MDVVDLADPAVAADPFDAYGRARERNAVVRLTVPGLAPMWGVTRYDGARAMLGDPRFVLTVESYAMRPRDVGEEYEPYLRTMQHLDGPEHLRLRRLVAPAFTARRAAAFRPRIEAIVESLLDDLGAAADGGVVDLVEHLAGPLPMEVICEIVGIDPADRPRWREHGRAVAAGHGAAFVAAIPDIIDGAKAAVARRRAEPADDIVSDLLRAQAEDGNRLDEVELVALVWQLVLAGQVPTNLLANAVEALLLDSEQLGVLRADPDLAPQAVEELTRWANPQLLAIPRYATEDVDLDGVRVRPGEPVVAVLASANRDPRVYAEPDRLDLRRAQAGHLAFAYGPHFCLGAAFARLETEVALTALLRRFPDLALAGAPHDRVRIPDPATWRLATLPVSLGPDARS